MIKRIVVLTVIAIMLFAQYSHTFTNIAHAENIEQIAKSAWDVDISPNGTIFVADIYGGILVYSFNDSELSLISQVINDDLRITNIKAVNDSLILASDYNGKLMSYEYTDSTLVHKAEILVETPGRITVVNDSTIFLSCKSNGLKVFQYDGAQFTLKISIDDVDWVFDSIMLNDSTMLLGAGGTLGTYLYQDTTLSLIAQIERIGSEQYFIEAKAPHLADDGTIFCANNSNGLLAFTYEDSVFSLIAIKGAPFLSMYEMEGFIDVEVKGNIVYVTGYSGGPYAYRYNGSSFELLDNRDEVNYGCFNVEVVGDTVFVANGSKLLWVYKFNGSTFSLLDRIMQNGSPQCLANDENGIVFSANGLGGLQVYQIVEDEFVQISHKRDTEYVLDVAVTPDGSTVFLANKRDGIGAYSFDGNDFTLIDRFRPEESQYYYYSTNDINSIELIGENKILFTHRVSMSDYTSGKSYSYGSAQTCIWNGSAFIDYSSIFSYPFDWYSYVGLVSDMAFISGDSVVAACGNDGITISNTNNRINTGAYVNDVDLLPNGTIITANSTAGLKIYEYDSGFTLVDNINNGGSAKNILRFQDGTLFLANGEDGLRSYQYDSEFICTAHIDDGGTANDVIVLPDSTIIVANGEDGLRAYRYNGFMSSDPNDTNIVLVPVIFELFNNYPNPFNSGTTIKYELIELADVQMMIYDISGRKIRQWSYQDQTAGTYEITWNGKNQNGNLVPSGVYIYRMLAGDFVDSKKMVLLK